MYQLQWCTFIQRISNHEEITVDRNLIMSQGPACHITMKMKLDVKETIQRLCDTIIPLESKFVRFNKEAKDISYLFSYWDDYISMVQLLLQFIKSERSGDWLLHLSTTAAMIPHVFEMDNQITPDGGLFILLI